MNQNELRYDRLVEVALLGVVRKALESAAPDSMPGEHHFYLTFRTRAPGIDIPGFLLEQYPEEMTIILQHQFWDLKTTDEYFEVTLSFNNRPADLHIPFAALTAFIDPSVKFGLQFNAETDDSTQTGTEDMKPANSGDVAKLPVVTGKSVEPPITAPSHEVGAAEAEAREASNQSTSDSADIVSLDTFRKK